jgi:ComEC/Rec2-related protein
VSVLSSIEPFMPGDPGRPAPSRRPALALACLVLGYALARAVGEAGQAGLGLWALGAGAGLAMLALLLRGRACRGVLAMALVLGAAGWFDLRVWSRPADDVARAAQTSTPRSPAIVTLRGVVLEHPRSAGPPRGRLGPAIAREQQAPGSLTFRVRVSGVEPDAGARPASGVVRVRVQSDEPLPAWLVGGAGVRLTGVLGPVAPALNPGEPAWELLAAQHGLSGDLDVSGPALLSERSDLSVAERVAAGFVALRSRLHERALAAVRPGLSPDEAAAGRDRVDRLRQARALLASLLLGERDPALRDVSEAFTRLGLLHMVAISGFNLAVMAGSAVFLLRLTGDRGPLEPLLIAVLVLAYLLVLPPQSPILRAGLLVLALLLSEALGRRYDRLSVLAWCALILLIWRPLDVWDLGFQLSFGVVAALLLLGDRFNTLLFGQPLLGVLRPHRRPGPPGWLDWVPGALAWARTSLKATVSASVLAWLVSTPVVIVHTGLISPLAIVSGLLILPLTVVLLWVGYGAMLLGTLVPPAAGVASVILDALAHALVASVLLLERLPLTSAHLPAVWTAWGAVAVGVVVWLVLRPPRRVVAVSAVLGVLGLLAAQVIVGPRVAGAGPLRVDALAVGEGSCTLVRSAGRAVLIDAGSRTSGLGERTIPQALRALGAWRVPTVIITRPTLDAFSALPDLIDPLGIVEVYVPPALPVAARAAPWSAGAAVLDELAARGVRVRTLEPGAAIPLGPASIAVQTPPPGTLFKTPGDAAVVLHVRAPDQPAGVLLLSGAPEATLLRTPPPPAPFVVLARPRALDTPTGQRLAHAAAACVVSASDRSPGRGGPSGLLHTSSCGTVTMRLGEDGRWAVSTFR